jgi:hypothetical protein
MEKWIQNALYCKKWRRTPAPNEEWWGIVITIYLLGPLNLSGRNKNCVLKKILLSVNIVSPYS